MSDPSVYAPAFPVGASVVAGDTEPSDHVRGIRDGAVGSVTAEDRGRMVKRGKKWERDVWRCPLVEFTNGERVWMAMHQLQRAA